MKFTTETASDMATIVAGLCAVVITGFVILREPQPAPVTRGVSVVEDWQRYADAPHRTGPVDAPVTIIAFGDYQCPFCQAAEPHIQAILRDFDGEIALVYRHFPLELHPHAYEAAVAAECAGEAGRCWEMHGRLMESMVWARRDSHERFVEIAASAGVEDLDAYDDCLSRDGMVPSIQADMRAVAELGIAGTPAFIVNGTIYRGLLDSLDFPALYDDALGR